VAETIFATERLKLEIEYTTGITYYDVAETIFATERLKPPEEGEPTLFSFTVVARLLFATERLEL
jgi:hypothetical protein